MVDPTDRVYFMAGVRKCPSVAPDKSIRSWETDSVYVEDAPNGVIISLRRDGDGAKLSIPAARALAKQILASAKRAEDA